MVKDGYAYALLKYPMNEDTKEEYKAAEDDARTNKRGLWAEDTCNGGREFLPKKDNVNKDGPKEKQEEILVAPQVKLDEKAKSKKIETPQLVEKSRDAIDKIVNFFKQLLSRLKLL